VCLSPVLGRHGSVPYVASWAQEPQATLHPRRLARTGRSPSVRRSLLLCTAAVMTALMTAAAAQSAPALRLESPQLDQIGRAAGAMPDSIIRVPAKTLALAPNGYWGGQYTTGAGELVTIYASNSYAVDQALG
jgi:hypothetical protein